MYEIGWLGVAPWLVLMIVFSPVRSSNESNFEKGYQFMERFRVSHLDHTLTDLERYRTLHLSLNLTVDMDLETVQGYVDINFAKIELESYLSDGDVVEHGLVLDIGTVIVVDRIEDLFSGGEVGYQVYCRSPTDFESPDPTVLWCALVLDQIVDRVGEGAVRIHYSTNSSSTALHFIQPAQTLQKNSKFLVSVTQPSDARGWIPCQDTAAMKQPYDAEIRIKGPYTALMSATLVEYAEEDEGWRVYKFQQRYPVPPFLIALTVAEMAAVQLQVGEMEEEKGETRSIPITIWGEEEFLKELEASGKLNMVVEMMDICQQKLGAYPYDRYDIVLTPPGYVFQGMEYPGMNYVSVTTLCLGDLSRPNYGFAEIVAHEMVHSWFGNMVTPKFASDAWLAEGITSFVAFSVLEQLYDAELACFLKREKYGALKKVLISYKAWPQYKVLTPALYTQNPFEGFSYVTYVKGSLFMDYLVNQTTAAGVDEFLLTYLARFRHQAVDSDDFIHVLTQSQRPLDMSAIYRWLERPATQVPLAQFSSAVFDECEILYKVMTNHPKRRSLTNMTMEDVADKYKSGNGIYLRRQLLIVLNRIRKISKTIQASDRSTKRWQRIIDKLDVLFHFSQLFEADPDMFAQWVGVTNHYNHTATSQHLVSFMRQNGRPELLYKALSTKDPALQIQMAEVLRTEYDLGSYPGFLRNMLQSFITRGEPEEELT